jgi:hypothetical protein
MRRLKNSGTHAERIEHGAAFGRDHASAGFVARKIQPIDDDDALDAEPAEMHGRGKTGGSSANDAHIGMDDRGIAADAAL